MPQGVIQGGWPYVIGAFVFSGIVLLSYGISLYLRFRNTQDGGRS